MGTQPLRSKCQSFLYFMNEFYPLCCCVVLCCLPAPQADLTRFRRVIVLWVSTIKRKTRAHTDFRSARRSKRINPLKITLPTQFLRRIEEEMSKLHVSSAFVDLKDNKDNSLHLGRKYARIFVLGHYLFLVAHSFPRASLSENCSFLGTDNVRGQISEHIFEPNGGYCLFSITQLVV